MRAVYDPTVDAMTIELLDREPEIPVTTRMTSNDSVLLDYDRGELYSIELLAPGRTRLAAIAAEHGFAHLLDDIYAIQDSALGWSAGNGFRFTWVEVSYPGPGAGGR